MGLALLALPAAGHPQRELLPAFVAACRVLCCEPAWAAHAAAAAQPAVAQSAVQLCLPFVSFLAVSLSLPAERRPEGCTWLTAARLGELFLRSRFLDAGLVPVFAAADGAAIVSALTAAAQLVQQVCQEPLPMGSGEQYCVDVRLAVLGLLMSFSAVVSSHPPVRQRLSSQQRQRVARALLAVVGRLPQQLQLEAHDSLAAEEPTDEQHLWLTGALTATLSCMKLLCGLKHDELALVGSLPQSPAGVLADSLADEAAWFVAASAALSCLPVVQRVRHHSPPEWAAQFATATRGLAWNATRAWTLVSAERSSLLAAAAECGIDMAAWEMHSRLAQLVHYAAAAEDPPFQLGNAQEGGSLLEVLSDSLGAAARLHALALGGPHPAEGADAHHAK